MAVIERAEIPESIPDVSAPEWSLDTVYVIARVALPASCTDDELYALTGVLNHDTPTDDEDKSLQFDIRQSGYRSQYNFPHESNHLALWGLCQNLRAVPDEYVS